MVIFSSFPIQLRKTLLGLKKEHFIKTKVTITKEHIQKPKSDVWFGEDSCSGATRILPLNVSRGRVGRTRWLKSSRAEIANVQPRPLVSSRGAAGEMQAERNSLASQGKFMCHKENAPAALGSAERNPFLAVSL